MDRYAVIGTPVYHSLSPIIHLLFAEYTEQILDYMPIEVKPEEFERRVRQLAGDGFKGMNITVPLKLMAWQLADERDEHAELAGAINTFKFDVDRKRIFGYNTDGIGLLRDLTQNHKIAVEGQRILILGAGGAVQGILGPLLAAKSENITIANRTVEKAEALAQRFGKIGNVRACGYDTLGNEKFDMIINASSSGLKNELPPLPNSILIDGGITYDLVYNSEPTAFVLWGRRHGASIALDGLGMLVEQAAESYRIWRGIMPETGAVIEQLKTEYL
jgi:shikimate dehydrogenase